MRSDVCASSRLPHGILVTAEASRLHTGSCIDWTLMTGQLGLGHVTVVRVSCPAQPCLLLSSGCWQGPAHVHGPTPHSMIHRQTHWLHLLPLPDLQTARSIMARRQTRPARPAPALQALRLMQTPAPAPLLRALLAPPSTTKPRAAVSAAAATPVVITADALSLLAAALCGTVRHRV